MKRRLIELAALLLLLAFLAVIVIASGIVPVKASSGHLPVTKAILSYAMRRSVATHALGTAVPDLADASRILKGAGHYDRGCQPCHGAPGEDPSIVMQELTPRPPDLSGMVPTWADEELFQIVKHGVKMTGMPAWPDYQRDDEVWDVVAFLRTLPRLTPAEYRRLVLGDLDGPDLDRPGLGRAGDVPPAILSSCARCHGPDGLGRGLGAFPRIAGQRAPYLAESLEAYANGARNSGIMKPIAVALDSGLIVALSRHYADAPATAPGDRSADGDLLSRGERIAHQGIPARKVPRCVECHGPGERPRNEHYPVLSGQYGEYLELQLDLFREGRRGGSEYAGLMDEVTHYLEPEQARAVAAWYASLSWPGSR